MNLPWLHFLQCYLVALAILTVGSVLYLIRILWPGK
jgi:hypothetical protein